LGDFGLFFATLATLFAIMDPFGTVGIFIAITPGESEQQRRRQAFFGCLWALIFLIIFFAVGSRILSFFGITVNAVEVGGGLILLKIAFDQLSTTGLTRHSPPEDAASRMQHDVSVFPLAMPLIAGPGALTLMITQAAHGHATTLSGWLSIGGAIIAALVIMWIALDRSVLIQRLLGANGLGAITRVMGFILACIAAQMTIIGIRGIVTDDTEKDAPSTQVSVLQEAPTDLALTDTWTVRQD
jgi:multiple antibiotic resistance protein